MSGRPAIVGADAGPEAPYPLQMEGKVIAGFGRGSKEVRTIPLSFPSFLFPRETCANRSPQQLGIPTANLPVDAAITPWIGDITSGVYFGYASLALPPSHPQHAPSSPSSSFSVFPMVMSIGYNPFYKNTVRSAEVHVLHKFSQDFYDAHMRLLITGFIREEKDYKSLEALIEDINVDCDVANKSLQRDDWQHATLKGGAWLTQAL